MRTVGMMAVDLRRGRNGLPGRSADALAGAPVLRRSVARALAASRLERVALLAPADQHGRIRELLGELAGDPRVSLHPLAADADGAFDSGRIRLARRWAGHCWRGGVGGATWFDELLAPRAMAELADELAAEAVVPLAAEAAVADAALLDAIVARHEAHRDRYHLAFSQAPPGLGGLCLSATLLGEMARTGATVGRLMAYDPARPAFDHVTTDACEPLGIELTACQLRFCADSARGLALLAGVVGQAGDSPPIGESVATAEHLFAAREPGPREIELELTTERGLADTLRPGRPTVPTRGPIAPAIVERLCGSIAAAGWDDLAVFIGGTGDPLLAPDALDIASAVKRAGAAAVALRTSGLSLDDALIARLLESDLDLLCVELDAASADAYRRLKESDAFDGIVDAMRKLFEARSAVGRPGPLLVAEMLKCPGTLGEMEAFFDFWKLGLAGDDAFVTGLNSFAGQFASSAGEGWTTAPPKRGPCVRLARRLTVLADGTAVACEQDFKALHPVGHLGEQTLAEIWAGEPMEKLRADHAAGRLADRPLCAACDQWHRP